MAAENKNGIKWRGLTTFILVLGVLVEILSGVVLYITPLGRFANWTNWTLLGLDKHQWAAVHTIFGYFLLIVIALHLYFNWRIMVHFFWSRMHSSFNLKREFMIATAIVAMIFAGTLWNIPPFSSVMDLGREAKLSWEKSSDMVTGYGGRRAQAIHGDGAFAAATQGDDGSWATSQVYTGGRQTDSAAMGMGRGRNTPFSGQPVDDAQYPRRGQGRGRMLAATTTPPHTDVVDRSANTLKGRDFVRMGSIETMTGHLVRKGNEWELKVGDAQYEIHMGPIEFRYAQGLVLTDGAQAVVTGFVYGTDLSVTTIETGGRSVSLRDASGRPAWAGTGFGRGTGSGRI